MTDVQAKNDNINVPAEANFQKLEAPQKQSQEVHGYMRDLYKSSGSDFSKTMDSIQAGRDTSKSHIPGLDLVDPGSAKNPLDAAKAELSKYADVPGFQSIANGKIPGLDGQHGNLPSFENAPQNMKLDEKGNLNYDLPKGIQGHDGPMKVTVNAESGIASFTNQKGEIVQYEDHKTGQVIDRRDDNGSGDRWFYDEPGKDPKRLSTGLYNDPKMGDDGQVKFGVEKASNPFFDGYLLPAQGTDQYTLGKGRTS